jgi:FkbM family methyltransferase
MRLFLKRIAAKFGYEIRHRPRALLLRPDALLAADFHMVVGRLLLRRSPLWIVQVGAFDGVAWDWLHGYVRRGLMKGILIEPQKDVFERLRANYRDCDGLHLENVAIAAEDGEQRLYRLKPEYHRLSTTPEQLASFRPEVIMKHFKGMGVQRETVLESESVRCLRIETLVRQHGLDRLDLLQIDAEGADGEILRTCGLGRLRPSAIHYEHAHLGREEREQCWELLVREGYRFTHTPTDTLALRKDEPGVFEGSPTPQAPRAR